MGWFGGSDDVSTSSTTTNLTEDERIALEEGTIFQSRDSSSFSIIDEFPESVQKFSGDVLSFADTVQKTSFDLLENVVDTLKESTIALGSQAGQNVTEAIDAVSTSESEKTLGVSSIITQIAPFVLIGAIAYYMIKK